MSIHMYEAECGRCGEWFNPDSPDDTEHLPTEQEEPCGGLALMVVALHTDGRAEVISYPFWDYQIHLWTEERDWELVEKCFQALGELMIDQSE